jgi:hypothetical protein
MELPNSAVAFYTGSPGPRAAGGPDLKTQLDDLLRVARPRCHSGNKSGPRGALAAKDLPHTPYHLCFWLRGLESNQDNQIQSLVAYQLADPGVLA